MHQLWQQCNTPGVIMLFHRHLFTTLQPSATSRSLHASIQSHVTSLAFDKHNSAALPKPPRPLLLCLAQVPSLRACQQELTSRSLAKNTKHPSPVDRGPTCSSQLSPLGSWPEHMWRSHQHGAVASAEFTRGRSWAAARLAVKSMKALTSTHWNKGRRVFFRVRDGLCRPMRRAAPSLPRCEGE